ncbi:MAG: peptide chain release factor 1 [Syntrophomonadaceae bacterium]|jgi:peptide chain release factor 1|nr:peptide chain release factor 1 [Syntrophomonadaceae bacterium]MDH7497156.1 peptide chain release factor 1 [Syntrophomonadaceae bacterium]
MLDKLDKLEEQYEEITGLLGKPEIIADQPRFQKYAKAHADMSDLVTTYREFKKVRRERGDVRGMLEENPDPEMRAMLEEELESLARREEELERALKILLLPQDPNDSKNVIMEIRAGTGGQEAALFAADLFKMYARYAEQQGWRVEIMDSSPSDLGGFKEIIFLVEGKGAYSRLKYESGVHRVQRIPVTESGGRIHTSAATVAVLPEAEEVEVEINPNDIRVDVFCSSGPGGQSVNTTQSAVRITHIPTGLVVSCQDEKSQHKNKDKAMRVLRARLLELKQAEHDAEIAGTRRSQVGSGDRSERIRTYNFPQGRVTDHRINLTLHKLDAVLAGQLNEIVDALISHDQAERLRMVD